MIHGDVRLHRHLINLRIHELISVTDRVQLSTFHLHIGARSNYPLFSHLELKDLLRLIFLVHSDFSFLNTKKIVNKFINITYFFFISLHRKLSLSDLFLLHISLIQHIFVFLFGLLLLISSQIILFGIVILFHSYLFLLLLSLALLFKSEIFFEFHEFPSDFFFSIFTDLFYHSESIFCFSNLVDLSAAYISSRTISCSWDRWHNRATIRSSVNTDEFASLVSHSSVALKIRISFHHLVRKLTVGINCSIYAIVAHI